MNDLDAQIHLRLWRRRIGNLELNQSCAFDGVRVSRPGRNRYVVHLDGGRYEIGGRNMSVLTASLKTLALVTGQPVMLPCTVCGTRPREAGSSHCAACTSQGVMESRRQRRNVEANRREGGMTDGT